MMKQSRLRSMQATPYGARIRSDVDRLMSQNRQARTQYPGEWWRLLAITRGRLNQLNHSGIALGRWLAEHADELEAHHAALGIEDPTRHNFRAWCHQRTMSKQGAKAA